MQAPLKLESEGEEVAQVTDMNEEVNVEAQVPSHLQALCLFKLVISYTFLPLLQLYHLFSVSPNSLSLIRLCWKIRSAS